jgi:predicted ArsR family transcriptional regulator
VRNGPGVSRHRLLDELKTGGPRTATELSEALAITPTAARMHLSALEDEGLVVAVVTPADGPGRPARRWTLTPRASRLFPDRHGDLTVQLLEAIEATAGEAGLDAVLAARDQRQREAYASAMDDDGVAGRLEALATARTAEGYMAEVLPAADADGWLFVEHHCPICEAAATCMGLCRSELETFRAVLGDDVEVERTEHLLSGGERCVYRVTPVSTPRRRSA